MKPDDLFVKPPKAQPKDVILFAGKDFTHSNDECFIVTDGVVSLPHAKVAEQLTRQTALWAYQVVRQRPFYWKEKLSFLKRIFRSTNLTLWQKRRDPGFDAGLASALMVLITIGDYFWLGSAGNCNSFLFRDGLIDVLTARDVDSEGMLTKAVGFARHQLIPALHSEKLLENDIILLASDSIAEYVSEDGMRGILEEVGTTTESLAIAVDKLIEIVLAAGSEDSMSLCMVKRIVI
ncbi:MAG: PP2C family serine/threonine-protein phosphatase [Candidatus Gottesmanbacteria bacterium]|nr:PP2C family serine/threonine-protein phosphatase [Candidatus Gottesmanbacteria bacterium]